MTGDAEQDSGEHREDDAAHSLHRRHLALDADEVEHDIGAISAGEFDDLLGDAICIGS